jgi:hypothetical protein
MAVWFVVTKFLLSLKPSDEDPKQDDGERQRHPVLKRDAS